MKPLPPGNGTPSRGLASGEDFIVLSALDISTIVRALYPERRLPSFSFDNVISDSVLQSSASSSSGFSLFQEPVAGTAVSSMTPSWPAKVDFTGKYASPASSRSDNGVLLDSMATETYHATHDREAIWEACNAVDDMLNSSPSDCDHWVILVSSGWTTSANRGDQQVLKGIITQKSTKLTGVPRVAEYGRDLVEELLNPDIFGAYYPSGGAYSVASSAAAVFLQLHDAIAETKSRCMINEDFLAAHEWSQKLRLFDDLFSDAEGLLALTTLLTDIEATVQLKLSRDETAVGSCDHWLRSANVALEIQSKATAKAETTSDRMRDKMWYTADVRTSAPYDEARCVVTALRVMGKSKKPSKLRVAPPLRHWNGSRLSATDLHLKREVQILELLSATPEQGGPNKLSDDQAKATLAWMERSGVALICGGEERLHKLCREIRNCVDQLTAADGTFLATNPLFAGGAIRPRTPSGPFAALRTTHGRLGNLSLHTNVPTSIDAVSSASHQLSSTSSREFFDSRSPTLTHRSSAPFWSPAMTDAQSPSSVTSVGSHYTPTTSIGFGGSSSLAVAKSPPCTIENLRQRLTDLLLSDLTQDLFRDGSEADLAYWTGLGGDIAAKHFKHLRELDEAEQRADRRAPSSLRDDFGAFDFQQAFAKLIKTFEASSSLSAKLQALTSLDQLLASQLGQQKGTDGYPRKKSGMVKDDPRSSLVRADSEASIQGFRRLFCDDKLRPSAILRDLQYIAALVPYPTLMDSPAGTALNNAAVAISCLKQEITTIMVETADSIIGYHSNNRGHGRASSTAQQQRDSATFAPPSRTSSAEEVARYTMTDAAYLLQVTAKEGNPVAQRELATLYLTHPDLMDPIIAPFTRPKDVFKEELENKWRKNQDPNRCDPATMCVAHHWMSLSSKGGDPLAKEYLRAREEMERLP
jgi:hypothetical protein